MTVSADNKTELRQPRRDNCINMVTLICVTSISSINSTAIFSEGGTVNGATVLTKAEGRQSHGSQAIEEQLSEEISSFKWSLLKGKRSQNASTNKFAPRDNWGMHSGQNNTCG